MRPIYLFIKRTLITSVLGITIQAYSVDWFVFLPKKLLLYSTITSNVSETRIQKYYSSLLTMKCLNVIDTSQDNRFRSNSCNVNDKASILIVFKDNWNIGKFQTDQKYFAK